MVQSCSIVDRIIGSCFATPWLGALLNLGRSLRLCDDSGAPAFLGESSDQFIYGSDTFACLLGGDDGSLNFGGRRVDCFSIGHTIGFCGPA